MILSVSICILVANSLNLGGNVNAENISNIAPWSSDENINGSMMNSSFESDEVNCTNEYCVSDFEYIDLILEHIFPTPFEWVLIVMHVITFVVGLVGNALVCIAVYKNNSMRNVTNIFIVNLAVADFMVILFCLPPTVVWDVTETWFMGTALCKIVLYFQVSIIILHTCFIFKLITKMT